MVTYRPHRPYAPLRYQPIGRVVAAVTHTGGTLLKSHHLTFVAMVEQNESQILTRDATSGGFLHFVG